jgi:hypothetical protein
MRMHRDTIMEYDNVLQALGEKRGRPQGSPPHIPSTPALTMTTTEVYSAFIVRVGTLAVALTRPQVEHYDTVR